MESTFFLAHCNECDLKATLYCLITGCCHVFSLVIVIVKIGGRLTNFNFGQKQPQISQFYKYTPAKKVGNTHQCWKYISMLEIHINLFVFPPNISKSIVSSFNYIFQLQQVLYSLFSISPISWIIFLVLTLLL